MLEIMAEMKPMAKSVSVIQKKMDTSQSVSGWLTRRHFTANLQHRTTKGDKKKIGSGKL